MSDVRDLAEEHPACSVRFDKIVFKRLGGKSWSSIFRELI
jgi:hypothetical protein